MGIYISRVQINNFRNFHKLDVHLGKKAVIVGENNSGKTNFVHALRLILDPNLPDTARQLKEEDFWDGIESPIETGAEIEICIDLKIAWLMYGRIGNHPSLDKFKKNNGFNRFSLTRYYLPLSLKGKIAIKMRLHRNSKDIFHKK